MPMYWDLTRCKRQWRHPWHVALATDYLLLLRRQPYSERPQLPAPYELALDDLTHDVVIIWAAAREMLGPRLRHHVLVHHQEQAEHTDDGGPFGAGRHGHVYVGHDIWDTLYKRGELRVAGQAYQRAERDLRGLVGLLVGASRAHLTAEAAVRGW